MDSKFDKPSQKLPSIVLAKRSLVRAVAVNHQARRVLQPTLTALTTMFMVIRQRLIEWTIVFNLPLIKYQAATAELTK